MARLVPSVGTAFGAGACKTASAAGTAWEVGKGVALGAIPGMSFVDAAGDAGDAINAFGKGDIWGGLKSTGLGILDAGLGAASLIPGGQIASGIGRGIIKGTKAVIGAGAAAGVAKGLGASAKIPGAKTVADIAAPIAVDSAVRPALTGEPGVASQVAQAGAGTTEQTASREASTIGKQFAGPSV